MSVNNEFWINDKDAKCWSCDEISSIRRIRSNDGFCPDCDQEIDLSDEPYTNKLESGE